MRSEAEEYGLELPPQDIEEAEKPPPLKKEEESRTGKVKDMHSGHPFIQSMRKEVFQSKGSHHLQAMDRSGWVQTDDSMFTVLPISLMRKCLQ